MKKPKKEPTAFSRRQFIGSCAAGASLLHIAPYLALTGCTPSDRKYPFTSGRKYHPLAMEEDEYRELEEGTFPMFETDYKEGIRIKVVFPGFFSSKKKFAKILTRKQKRIRRKKYKYISIDNIGWSNISGRPELPFFGFLMHIPKFLDYKWDKTILPEYDVKVYRRMVVYPSQVRYFDNINNKDNFGHFEYDRDYYKSDIEPDEDQIVQVSDPFNIGYSRFVLIKVKPLLYNPKKKCIYGYSGVSIDFKFEVNTQIDDMHYLETPFLPSHLEYIPEHERIIDPWCSSNPDGSRNIDFINNIVDNFSLDINKHYVEEKPELLIIYGGDKNKKISLEEPARRLKEHKINNRGIYTEDISYDSLISDPNFESLKKSIREIRAPRIEGETIYFSKLKDVILLGDLDLIPCNEIERSLFEDNNSNEQPPSVSGIENESSQDNNVRKFLSDYYCATLTDPENRNDIIISDIGLGRIPAKDEDEANTVVENIIHYETNPYQVRQNLTFAGYFQDTGKDGYKCNGIASTNYIQTLEDIRLKLHERDVSISTIYEIQDREFIDQELRYMDMTPVKNPESMFTGTEDLKNRILEAFKSGNRIIVHRDHGYMNGWSRPSFKIPDLWALFSADKKDIPSSIVFNINCLSGHFVGEKTNRMPETYYDCFSEVLLKGPVLPDGIKQNLKCPAVVASVEESPTFHNDWLIKGIFDGIYGGILSRKNNVFTQKKKLSDVLNYGKTLLITCLDDPCLNMYENEIYHMLGDPTILI